MLKRITRAIGTTAFILAANVSLLAQEAEKVDVQTPCFTSKISDRETKWYRHELGIFSICIPETMARKKTARCGDRCYVFENDEFFFDVDLSVSAWRPTFEKRYVSFLDVNKTIDGKPASVWFFEDKGKYKYVSGVNIILERGQIGMGVYLFSKVSDPRPIAGRMFGSIRFIKPDSK